MTATAAATSALPPQTPALPEAKPETLGLSPRRLQVMSDAFKREIDKGTIPGVARNMPITAQNTINATTRGLVRA